MISLFWIKGFVCRRSVADLSVIYTAEFFKTRNVRSLIFQSKILCPKMYVVSFTNQKSLAPAFIVISFYCWPLVEALSYQTS